MITGPSLRGSILFIPNRPDMVVVDKGKKIAQIINLAGPLDKNIKETSNTKIGKYQSEKNAQAFQGTKLSCVN